ncbi:MAG: hypothetical protein JWM59_3495 [Verrucomicrobiales bacterium]|nr:hypothetical protein [Verrucomicrobiales bacterium]
MNSPYPLQRAAVLAAALFLPSSAMVLAAPVPVPAVGEVFVGFRTSSGEGSSTSCLIKLGADTLFRNAAPGTTLEVTGLGSPGTDLTATYGNSWSTRSDLYWGIFASRVSASSVVYASRPRTTPETPAEPWPALPQISRNATAQSIVDVLSSIGGYQGSEATANSPVATLQNNTAEDSSYFKQVGTPGTTDFGSLSQWTGIEAGFGGGPAGAALDLFRISSTGSTFVGTFTISAAGVITFTNVVTAEPNADTDGDGFSDAIETLAGTNSASAADYPRSQVSVTAEGPRIQTATAAVNRTYTIEYSETLEPANSWISVGTHATGATAAPVDFVDTDAGRRAKARGFYRVRFSS